MNVRLLFFYLLVFIINTKLNAQFTKNLELGVNLGQYVYQGDLTPNPFGSFKTSKTGWGLLIQKPFSPSLAIRLQYNKATLRGNDALYNKPEYRKQRAFSFQSKLNEISGLIVYNSQHSNLDKYGKDFFIYGFSGVGVSIQNLVKDYSNIDTKVFPADGEIMQGLAIDNTKPNFKIIPFIPIGAGVEKRLSEKWSAFGELNYRLIYNDYIDGFSKSANPKLKDKYYSANVGIKYILGKKSSSDCPSVL